METGVVPKSGNVRNNNMPFSAIQDKDPCLEEVTSFRPSLFQCADLTNGLLVVGHDLCLQLDSLPSSCSNPHSYSIPSNTALAGSYNNWQFENVQVFRVL